MCDVLSGITDKNNAKSGGSYINISRKFLLFNHPDRWPVDDFYMKKPENTSLNKEKHNTIPFFQLSMYLSSWHQSAQTLLSWSLLSFLPLRRRRKTYLWRFRRYMKFERLESLIFWNFVLITVNYILLAVVWSCYDEQHSVFGHLLCPGLLQEPGVVLFCWWVIEVSDTCAIFSMRKRWIA